MSNCKSILNELWELPLRIEEGTFIRSKVIAVYYAQSEYPELLYSIVVDLEIDLSVILSRSFDPNYILYTDPAFSQYYKCEKILYEL